MPHASDFLVIGSGVAGLSFALKAAQMGTVTVMTKDVPVESNSRYAQGGIAAVWGPDDDIDSHIQDTLVAGAGLCRPDAVALTVREGPARIRELIDLGVRFTRSVEQPEEYDLHREGGHAYRRILHADDLTGAELVRALSEAAFAHPNIEILDHHAAVDLITRGKLARRRQQIPPEDDEVVGVYALDQRTGLVCPYAARFVVLATGGSGRLYRFTTNPAIATGDGVAMAWRAGARVANMEFVQFHPTALYHPKNRTFLVSEALRGEGGRLVLPSGEPFMRRYDERGDLAPRDIVARAIDSELKRNGLECVHLDMSHMSEDQFASHFPNIYRELTGLGISPATEPIPVVPAAHYQCGGVQTDLHGASSLGRLLAIGETACSGLHGANRLASNSLLEATVFADRAARWCAERRDGVALMTDLPEWETGRAQDPDERVVIHQTWQEVRRYMWNYVGIVRTHNRMKRARRRTLLVQEEIEHYYWDYKLTLDLIELRNLATVADLVIQSALRRRESRGLHYNLDFQDSDPRFLHDTVLQRFM